MVSGSIFIRMGIKSIVIFFGDFIAIFAMRTGVVFVANDENRDLLYIFCSKLE